LPSNLGPARNFCANPVTFARIERRALQVYLNFDQGEITDFSAIEASLEQLSAV
jgi:hypothetical protein